MVWIATYLSIYLSIHISFYLSSFTFYSPLYLTIIHNQHKNKNYSVEENCLRHLGATIEGHAAHDRTQAAQAKDVFARGRRDECTRIAWYFFRKIFFALREISGQ